MVSDRKFWEGHDYMCYGIKELTLLFGATFEVWELKDEAECDGSTPDKFSELKSVERTHVYKVTD